MSEEVILASASTACNETKGSSHDKQSVSLNLHHHKKGKQDKDKNKGKNDICNIGISIKQKQFDKEFLIHKQHVLANLASNACDHSPKGGVDRDCLPLMKTLNEHTDYITTSSCSGRIALFHSVSTAETRSDPAGNDGSAVKRGHKDAQGWLVVKHGLLTEQEIDTIVENLCGSYVNANNTHNPNAPHTINESSEDGVLTKDTIKRAEMEIDGVWVHEGILSNKINSPQLPTFGTLTLKMEPFVMHVACRSMSSAKLLLSAAASDSGFRNSGVTPPGKKIICAIRHAAGLGLDVPLIVDGVNYVTGQHDYVRRLLLLANEKMQVNEVKLRKLEKAVAHRLAEGKQSD
ncbi:tRNA wybutosine-synthesizing protein 3 [Trypanosoma theileri]|uniref:tRNA(Phe) 7-[(3-amino-3-carboxypropyl)-4-demethylwyosine(37)-N(4)]-methyltransferase n=1 Tax=Trypanosoma theileri TaxID=67003 RepID=A0A1X0NNC3_9TRYP|nr:tRNA wybutosine-synthesizing protein 3 [Trypanosoma theileri]ORC85988.1 tRNA wybutosine-synthesizing protein 3 [Trypanosoma theileri]